MPADPIHPDQLDGQERLRADLVAYLDSLPIGELAELLGELPRSCQEPLGVLMIALNERLLDGFKLLASLVVRLLGPCSAHHQAAVAGEGERLLAFLVADAQACEVRVAPALTPWMRPRWGRRLVRRRLACG